jgi:hypothetical protein
MADSFFDTLGKHLFIWSGWVFTVGGAVGSFVLGQANAWIGWLAICTGVLALTGHAFALHRRCRELEEATEKQTARLQEAERKLNEVPLDLVNRIRELIAPQSAADVAAQLAAHADFVVRVQQFIAATSGDIHLRTFIKRDDRLFAIAKVATAALVHLRDDDAFVLVRSAEGLRTDCALMVVHQKPDPAHGVVYFRLVEILSDEVRALEKLAAEREVTGLTGYTLRPACDHGWYGPLESATISDAIKRLAEGLERERGAGT